MCVHEDVKSLLESDCAKLVLEKIDLVDLWQQRSHEFMGFLRTQENRFVEVVRNWVEEHLPGYTVEGDIPSDGHAMVVSVQDVWNVNFNWSEHEKMGPGWLFIPFGTECELELEFGVHRSDAFHVPDWVHVEVGDFEKDAYFAASGSRVSGICGEFRIELSDEDVRLKNWSDPDIEIELGEIVLFDEEPLFFELD